MRSGTEIQERTWHSPDPGNQADVILPATVRQQSIERKSAVSKGTDTDRTIADSSIWTDKKAALFDMDGTLVDSMWMWTDIDVSYLTRFPQARGTDIRQLQNEIEGMGMEETAVYFKKRFAIPDSLQQMQADWDQMAMERYRSRVPLKPGAREMLVQMKERGLKTGICTSNSAGLMGAALKANHVEDLFDVVLTANEVGRGKPYPDIYLEAAGRVGVDPGRIIVFEDIVNGVLAGKRAGMEVCGVADQSYQDHRQDLIEAADYFVEDFRPLLVRS